MPLKADWLWQEDPSVTGQTTCLRSKTLPDAEWRSVIRRPLLNNGPPPLSPPLPPPKRQPPTPPTSSAHLLRLSPPPLCFRCGNENRTLTMAHSWKHFPLASVRLLQRSSVEYLKLSVSGQSFLFFFFEFRNTLAFCIRLHKLFPPIIDNQL